ncbi:hypothetical protein D3C86_1890780 [compost metagenome]
MVKFWISGLGSGSPGYGSTFSAPSFQAAENTPQWALWGLLSVSGRAGGKTGSFMRVYASGPVAMGAPACALHSLHEPGYRAAPVSPATSMASRLWQAVTPEPHWLMTSAGARPFMRDVKS